MPPPPDGFRDLPRKALREALAEYVAELTVLFPIWMLIEGKQFIPILPKYGGMEDFWSRTVQVPDVELAN